MKFRIKPKILKIEVGKSYWVDFKDPYLANYRFIGKVKVIANYEKCSSWTHSNYKKPNWFQTRTLSKNNLVGILNPENWDDMSLFVNDVSFKREI